MNDRLLKNLDFQKEQTQEEISIDFDIVTENELEQDYFKITRFGSFN